MKILHLGKYFPPRFGGIETFMSQLMEEQAKQGLEVSALVHADNLSNKNTQYQWNGCNIYEVKSYGQLIFAPIAPGYAFKLITALNTEKPEILHIHMPNLSVFWVLVLRFFFMRKPKVIIHWHSDVLGASPTKLVRLFYPIYRLFESWLLRKADKIIATSPPYLESSFPLKRFKNKCIVIPLGLKLKNFDTASREIYKSNVLKLCMIGRLAYYKGHSIALQSLKHLKERNIQVTLDVIGDGELRETLLKECTELGLDGIVTWYGNAEETLKDEILKRSDLLLLTSFERTEAFGVVILEAANFGVPALVSNVEGSGMSFVVEHGKSGIVTECNAQDIANVLSWHISGDLVSLGRLGQAAHSRLQHHFEISQIAFLITKEYEVILNGVS